MNQQILYPRPRTLPSMISLMQYEPQKSTIIKIKEILKSHENFETILSEDNYENAILSDADKLERCRLENILPTYTPEIIKRKIGLDPRRFNFPLSKNLISLAQALQKSSQFEQKTYTTQPFYCVMLTAKQLGILA